MIIDTPLGFAGEDLDAVRFLPGRGGATLAWTPAVQLLLNIRRGQG
ncbi:MAG: hypothetical protein M0Q13_15185 [Methanothrix sp.]|nr:hypothetical protein [Methanothrix sp.]